MIFFPKEKRQRDAVWYGLSNALPPVVSLLLGPLVLKKIGLEDFATLGLMAYFVGFASTYSDFGGFSHLVAAFSRNAAARAEDFANIFFMKVIFWALFAVALFFTAALLPRNDALYSLLGISLLGLPFSLLNIEWYFIARREFFRILMARLTMLSVQAVLTLWWVFSETESVLFVPAILVLSGLAAVLLLITSLPQAIPRRLFPILNLASPGGAAALFVRLLPVAGTAFLTPYFLAYAMPWFAMTTSDGDLQGTFSIAYRLAMGFASLVGPFVFFTMPGLDANAAVSKKKILGASLLATFAFWAAGLLIMEPYFRVATVDITWLPYARIYFTILLVAVFFGCVRTPYVAKTFMGQRYGTYFAIHATACLPVVFFSWYAGDSLPHGWVPWMACLPDVLATSGFLLYFHFGPGWTRASPRKDASTA